MRREIRLVVEHLCDTEDTLLNRDERERLVEEVLDETFGLGPLELLLKDPTISDILINGPEATSMSNAAARWKRPPSVPRQRSPDADHRSDRVEGRPARGRSLPDGRRPADRRFARERDHSAAGVGRRRVSIRRFGSNPLKLEDLLNYKAFTPEMVMLLEGAIKARLNIIISGGTGSGKTTLLNTLSSFIPNDRPHRDDRRRGRTAIAARARRAAGNAAAEHRRQRRHHGHRPGASNALRMRPERVIIGECRGAETLDMLQAMNTGHEGSMTTLHANTPRDAIAVSKP